MKTSITNYWFKLSVALMATVIMSSSSFADDGTKEDKESSREKIVKQRRLNTISRTQIAAEGFEAVEMFSAIDNGDVEVVIRAKNAAESNLVVKNNTDRPLAIQMPSAFSAVPVMRQGGLGLGGAGGGNQGGLGGGQQGGGLGGGQQGVGGGFGGGQQGGNFGGGGRQGGGGGVFNIPPGKSGRVAVRTVCLEEGKPDPKSRIDYVIQPLDKLNTDPKIYEMIQMLANDEIAQPVAQAAAWHVANGLSWQELLVKNRLERMDGYYERYFHPNHIHFAQNVVVAAGERAELRAEAKRAYEKAMKKESTGDYYDANDQ